MRRRGSQSDERSGSRTAAIYVRISDDKAGESLGIQRQEEDCQKLAAQLGYTEIRVFSDNDVSAFSGRRRPAYEDMLSQLADGQICAVISWHGDRLHRSPLELEAYIDVVERNNIETHLVTGGRVDLSTPTGRMIARTVGNMARYESEHKAERIERAHRQAAEQGRWRGGTRPFGYAADAITLDPVECELVRDAYRAVLDGTSLGEICRLWNGAGIRTTTGRAWGIQSLKQLLLRERNIGQSLYRGIAVATGVWDRLVDEATFRQVRLILTDPSRRRSQDNRSRWLLAGVAQCGVCELDGLAVTVRSATATSRGRSWTIYRCRGGQHLGRRADAVDALVEEAVLAYLERPDTARTLLGHLPSGSSERGDSSREEDLLRRLADAKSLWIEGLIGADDLRAVKAEVERKRQELSAALVPPRARPVVAKLKESLDIRAAWGALTVGERKQLVGLLMAVTILPVPTSRQRRFHEDLIRIDWRDRGGSFPEIQGS
ncbi:recombinase family protein [Sinomonas soli]